MLTPNIKTVYSSYWKVLYTTLCVCDSAICAGDDENGEKLLDSASEGENDAEDADDGEVAARDESQVTSTEQQRT